MERQHGSDTTEETGPIGKTELGMALDTKLAGVDLNLLVALEALLTCRNVTHAAHRLGQAQPAISRALARLRELLGDDLLVRSSSGMKLTAHGEYLAKTLPTAMTHVRDVISSREIDGRVRLSVNANLTPALLPYILQSEGRRNKPLKVNTHNSPEEGIVQLRTRTTEYMLGAVGESDSDIESEMIFAENFVTLVAFERHKTGGIRPTEESFLELTHINLVENGSEMFPQLSEALMSYGMRRSRLFEVPNVTSAALMVSESELALTVPRSIAGWLTKTLRLSALLPPIPIPPQEVEMSWLAGTEDVARRRVIDDIGVTAREAITQDQASIRILRSISPGE